MSRTLTGIVKAGYSPHEQYSTDSRLQGPWSDLFALGGTLYRAVTGKTPEEAALRVDEDHMPPATQAAKGRYRPDFLSAIDACLKVRHSERPRSVAQLRPMLLGGTSQAKREPEPATKAREAMSAPPQTRKVAPPRPSRTGRWLVTAAAILALLGGAYGGVEFMRWQPGGPGTADAEVKRQAAETEARRKVADAAQRQAALDAERRRQDEAAAIAQRQTDLDAERRRNEAAEASQRQANIEAEQRRRDETERVAAAETARRSTEEEEVKRNAEERARVAAATLSAEARTTFVRQVQQVLKQGRCYDGAMNGRSNEDTQDALDNFVANVGKKRKPKPARIELAKATAGDFETWLRDAGEITGDICAKPKPPKQEVAKPARQREESQRARAERPAAQPKESPSPAPKLCWGYRNELAPCRQ